jgi:hypothetical protein
VGDQRKSLGEGRPQKDAGLPRFQKGSLARISIS